MRKKRMYSIEVARPGQGLTEPPFFKVDADTITFEQMERLRSEAKRQTGELSRAWDWEVCKIRRSR